MFQAEYVLESRGGGDFSFSDSTSLIRCLDNLNLKKGKWVTIMVEYSAKPAALVPIVKEVKKRGYSVEQSGLVLVVTKK
jgi:hypothetical protein